MRHDKNWILYKKWQGCKEEIKCSSEHLEATYWEPFGSPTRGLSRIHCERVGSKQTKGRNGRLNSEARYESTRGQVVLVVRVEVEVEELSLKMA